MTTTEEIVGLLRWFKVNGLLPELRDDMPAFLTVSVSRRGWRYTRE